MAQYQQDQAEISLSMLLEVIDALKGYGSDVVVVGGWAPYFLLQKHGSEQAARHVGSLDGDLALNFQRIPEDKYETILETLHRLGYQQRKNAQGRDIPASYDFKAKSSTSFLGGISAQDVAFSNDGERVTYVLFPEGTLWKSKADGSDKVQLSYPPVYAMQPRWSPDGTQLVFWVMQSGKPPRIYITSINGGTPRELMPDSRNNIQSDATWSPDGNSIAFTGGPSGGGPSGFEIDILDLKTHQVSMLADSQGFYSPRWSPDGRYILAEPNNAQSIRLYDFKLRKWSMLFNGRAAYPCWSRNGEYVYFLSKEKEQVILRVSIRDQKVEQVASLKEMHTTGYWGEWLGLAPDDSPLTLKDVGTEEIVSMNFHEP